MMTRKRARMMPPLFVVLALVAAGCAEPPAAEIQAARQAMDVARSAGAPDYAPDAWAEAEGARARLEVELEAQQDKTLAITRSYVPAKALAAEVETAAQRAAEAAEAGKEAARVAASRSLDEARALLREVRDLVARAPHGKGTGADLAALDSDAGASGASLEEAEAAFAEARYLDAKAKADAVLAALGRIKTEIVAATEARRPA